MNQKHDNRKESGQTRPLIITNSNNTYYYTHDANKNVTEIISSSDGVISHYEYCPFGAITINTNPPFDNSFTFSSEYFDSELGLIYYNYRHYNPLDGRWIGRDPIEEEGGYNLYDFIQNNVINMADFLGKDTILKVDGSPSQMISGVKGQVGYHMNVRLKGDIDCALNGILTVTNEQIVSENTGGTWTIPRIPKPAIIGYSGKFKKEIISGSEIKYSLYVTYYVISPKHLPGVGVIYLGATTTLTCSSCEIFETWCPINAQCVCKKFQKNDGEK